jgi:hypothetical protein
MTRLSAHYLLNPRASLGSAAWRVWMSCRPCVACHDDLSAPARPVPLRARGPVAEAVPMCRRHEREYHFIGVREFQCKYGLSVQAEADWCAELWARIRAKRR